MHSTLFSERVGDDDVGRLTPEREELSNVFSNDSSYYSRTMLKLPALLLSSFGNRCCVNLLIFIKGQYLPWVGHAKCAKISGIDEWALDL